MYRIPSGNGAGSREGDTGRHGAMPTIKEEESAGAPMTPADPSPVNATNNNAEDVLPTDRTDEELFKFVEDLEKEGLTDAKEECVEVCQTNTEMSNDFDLFDPDAKNGKYNYSGNISTWLFHRDANLSHILSLVVSTVVVIKNLFFIKLGHLMWISQC